MKVIQYYGAPGTGKTANLIARAQDYQRGNIAEKEQAARALINSRTPIMNWYYGQLVFWDEFIPSQAPDVPKVDLLIIATQQYISAAQLKDLFGEDTKLIEAFETLVGHPIYPYNIGTHTDRLLQ